MLFIIVYIYSRYLFNC